MRYIRNSSTDAAYNMAFDEYLLEQLPLGEPVFCLWQNAPSVIIGLNQNAYTEVNLPYLRENGIQLARRVTGGGAVYHDLQNLNYTIVGRTSQLEVDYPRYMHFVIDALRDLGVPAEQNGRNDILVEGRKVSGYAKRVWKDRLMVHGTLMYDVDLQALSNVLNVEGSKFSSPTQKGSLAGGIPSVHAKVANLRDYLPQFSHIGEMKEELERILSNDHTDTELTLDESQLSLVGKLADDKFRTWEWIYGRSPLASIVKSRKFPCGTIEVYLTLQHGLVESLSFGGDFIGNLPSDTLAAQITGCRYLRDDLLERLSTLSVDRYFDFLSAEDLTSLLIQ
ncbi:MAG: lipoate--protein ligase [Bacteroidaceae bacterium]|nr:lipoate--protein ligase [Bacteroidaceae bacterium]